MQQSRRLWLLAACGVFVLTGTLVWAAQIKQRSDASVFFAAMLQQESISEQVVVGGVRYTVSDGKVRREDNEPASREETFNALRTAYALTTARRDPLMSLEGTDPDELTGAVSALRSVQEAVASAQTNESDAEAVASALYPVGFLNSVASAERSRRTFLMTKDLKDWETYRLAQKIAVSAYASDARRFEKAYVATVPRDSGKLGVAGGRILSRESELAAIDGIQHNADLVRKALDARDRCISGSVLACDTSDTELPQVEADRPGPVPDTSLTLAEEVQKILVEATLSPAERAAERARAGTKRMVELSKSVCIGSSYPHPVFFLREQETETGANFVFLSFTGNILITKASSFSGSPYFDYFQSKGVEYVPYWPTSTYTCPQLGGEYGIALAVLSVEETARSRPFSALLKYSAPALVEAEDTLLSGPVLRESDARRYLVLVYDSIALESFVPKEAENEYITLALQFDDLSAGSADLIYRLVGETRTNLRNGRTDVPTKLSAPYLFFARSAFFSLFMGHNRSFAPEQTLPYEPDLLPNSEQPYMLYSDIRSSVPHDKLLHDISYMTRLEGWNY